eukprot:TRINITY_DN5923_c0_g1_i1.p1 TRINITY_DN5923_c0_g1~~TRINITY_DN5923_c0_g1_i1.p1  ORF type:complete len:1001 (-),score=285.20 TRINITY_DN5923_c0_g1_i1:33-3035(-)
MDLEAVIAELKDQLHESAFFGEELLARNAELEREVLEIHAHQPDTPASNRFLTTVGSEDSYKLGSFSPRDSKASSIGRPERQDSLSSDVSGRLPTRRHSTGQGRSLKSGAATEGNAWASQVDDEIEVFMNDNNKLKQQVNELEKANRDLQQQVEDMSDLLDLASMPNSRDDEVTSGKAKLTALPMQLQKQKHMKEGEDLRQEVEIERGHVWELKEQLAEEQESKNKQAEELRLQVDDYAYNCKQETKSAAVLRNELSVLQSELEESRQWRLSQDEREDELATHLPDNVDSLGFIANVRLQEGCEELQQLRERCEELQQQEVSVSAECRDLISKAHTEAEESDQLHLKLGQQKHAEVQEINSQAQQLEQMREKLGQEMQWQTWHSELQAEHKELQRTAQVRNGEMGKLRAEVVQQARQFTEEREQNKLLATRGRDLNDSVQAHEEELEQMHVEIGQEMLWQARHNELLAEHTELQSTAHLRNGEMRTLRGEVVQQAGLLTEQREQIKLLATRGRDLNDSVQAHEDELEQLHVEMGQEMLWQNELRAEHTELQRSAQVRNGEMGKLRAEVVQQAALLTEQREQSELLSTRSRDLNASVQDREEELEQLRAQLAAATHQQSSMDVSRNILEEHMQQLQDTVDTQRKELDHMRMQQEQQFGMTTGNSSKEKTAKETVLAAGKSAALAAAAAGRAPEEAVEEAAKAAYAAAKAAGLSPEQAAAVAAETVGAIAAEIAAANGLGSRKAADMALQAITKSIGADGDVPQALLFEAGSIAAGKAAADATTASNGNPESAVEEASQATYDALLAAGWSVDQAALAAGKASGLASRNVALATGLTAGRMAELAAQAGARAVASGMRNASRREKLLTAAVERYRSEAADLNRRLENNEQAVMQDHSMSEKLSKLDELQQWQDDLVERQAQVQLETRELQHLRQQANIFWNEASQERSLVQQERQKMQQEYEQKQAEAKKRVEDERLARRRAETDLVRTLAAVRHIDAKLYP